MPQAITAAELRSTLESTPGLVAPATLTDAMLSDYIQQQTGVVLQLRGFAALPSAGLDLDVVRNAVLDLCTIQVRRYLRPDDPVLLDALRREIDLIRQGLKVIEGTGSGARFLEMV